ncbi:MAG: DUF523 domain-containing protein [Clostridia bacterium]|nr:DUF523 domain-containing protein [Clostridia bacterium]
MKTVLVSRCLFGEACRYDGASHPCPGIEKLQESFRVVLICPECDGGLPIPRPAGERRGDRIETKDGCDLTACYRRGAEIALQKAKETGATLACLKSKSPSCGVGLIYDGSFSGRLTAGDGVTAELLKANGVAVFPETALDALLAQSENEKEGGTAT